MKIEPGSVKYLIVMIFSISVFGILLFPIFDYFWCKFITHSTFEYSIYGHVIEPIIYGTVCGIAFWIMDRKKKK